MPDPTIAPPQPNPSIEQRVAHDLFSYFVSRCDDWQPGTAGRVYDCRTDGEALDYLLRYGPLYEEETHAMVAALRLLDPDRFGQLKLAEPPTTLS